MKKLLALLLALAMVFALAACGGPPCRTKPSPLKRSPCRFRRRAGRHL